MTRQEAREKLEGTFLFQLRDDKIVLRDIALVEAVKAYETEVRHFNHPHELGRCPVQWPTALTT